ncbi:MAG: type II secretion system protein GspM [Thermodesulfobacteriota bacterium]|nr:type II secretion system protein GspM [Thermodesulfobacteriota bacterium]
MNNSPASSYFQTLMDKTPWKRLAKREKIMVGGMIVFVLVFFIIFFIFSPILESRQRLQKSLTKKQVELQEIRILEKEYQALQLQSGDIQKRLAKRPDNFTLFSFIEKQATTAGIKAKINYIKPSTVESDGPLQESRVDMKLQQITLENLVTFLKGVESHAKVVSVSRISIQEHGKEQGYVNTVIQIITFQKQTT